MKILIAYSSKSGTVAECAVKLASMFKNYIVELANLAETNPSPDEYDIVVIGASIRIGKISKIASNYIIQNEETLLKKKVAFFLCTGYPEQFDNYIENNIPQSLRSASFALGNFGGSIDKTRFHGIEKLIVRIMRNSINNAEESDDAIENVAIPAIIPENINRFVNEIKGKLT